MELLSEVLSADSANAFWEQFNKQCTGVQVGITELGVEDIVPMKKHMVKLQAFATECTDLLPSYDVKRAQEILDEVGRLLRVREETLKPKKKFRFKSRDNLVVGASKEKKDVSTTVTVSSSTGVGGNQSDDTSYSVRDRHQEEIILDKDIIGEANGVIRSLLITGCSNTTIFARCVLGSVRIEDCDNCTFYLGPTRTSVYLDKLSTCTAFLASHQLRIHVCKDCQLCVRCNSHPIIEDCQGMGFAPYDVEYALISTHFGEAALREARCWDNVVDFRWHRATASPNWKVLLPHERPVARVVTEKDGTITTWGSNTKKVGSTAAVQISAKDIVLTAETVFRTEAGGVGDDGNSDDDDEL
jgi:hypothetical protein